MSIHPALPPFLMSSDPDHMFHAAVLSSWLRRLPHEAQRVAEGLAQAVLRAEGRSLVFFQEPGRDAARRDRPERMPDREERRGEDEQAELLRGGHAGRDVFYVRRHVEGEGRMDRRDRPGDRTKFERILRRGQ